MEARPMPTDCSSGQLGFEGFEGRQVVGAFDGGAVTSNAGATLLREADRAIGLTAKVARCFRDGRAAEFVVHNIETLLAQRVHAIALGYEDINDHDELRHDPVLGHSEPAAVLVADLSGGPSRRHAPPHSACARDVDRRSKAAAGPSF